jgi:acetolactate synthase-1/2/3 large subunit
MSPDDIRYELEKAAFLARSGRGGPVWLDIPLDVQAARIDPERLRGFTPPPPAPSDALDAQALAVIDLINAAQRPLLLGGFGVRLAGASAAFAQLYETLGIPVATTWPALSLIAAGDPLSIGRPGGVAQRAPNFAVQNCDLIISIGARLESSVTAFNPAKFARNACRVVVDVDPAELAKFAMPLDLAIEADAGAFIAALLRHADALARVDRGAWLERCASWKRRYPVGDHQPIPASGTIGHYDFVRALSAAVPPGATIVTCSSGLAVEFFYAGFENKPGQRVFNTSGLGAMGYGLPAIVGTAMATPGEPIVAIEGDGGMMFNLQELLTIRALDIPVRLFITNNGGYASIRASQRHHFAGRFVGTGPEAGLALPDFVELATAVGIPAIRIADASELHDKVAFTLGARGPFICDVTLIHDEALWPKSTAFALPDGSMMSMPLEDLAPLLPRDELRENMLVPLDEASERVSSAALR